MTPPRLLLEELTWPEVERAIEDGFRTVVVAVGATEQHGPALPLAVDAIRGTRLALSVAERLDGALVGPTIPIGCSDHHMAFPGTLTLRVETLAAICTDYVTSLAHHGFRRICFVPSHGGNFKPLEALAPELNELTDAEVYVYTDLVGFVQVWKDTTERVAGLGDRVGGHADIVEASEILVVRPDLVRVDRAEAGRPGDLTTELVERIMTEGFKSVTPNGVLGDTRGMHEDIGHATYEDAAEVIAADLRAQMDAGLS